MDEGILYALVGISSTLSRIRESLGTISGQLADSEDRLTSISDNVERATDLYAPDVDDPMDYSSQPDR